MVNTTEHNLVVFNDNGNVTACNEIASESTSTKQWLQNGDISIKELLRHIISNGVRIQEREIS